MEINQFLWRIMDATADDWESLEQIVLHFRRWYGGAEPSELADGIAQLVSGGLMEEMDGRAFTPHDLVREPAELWFGMDLTGRRLWETETPRFEDEETQPEN